MKKTLWGISLIFFYCSFGAFSQEEPTKIKVVLLGTFHYSYTPDAHKTSFSDLFSTKRQSELDDIAQKIALAKPDKIFVEALSNRQSRLDSLFNIYKKNNLADTTKYKSETYQLGFRMAKAANLKNVLAVDHTLDLPFAEYQDAQKSIFKIPQDSLQKLLQSFPSFFKQDKPINLKQFPDLAKTSLTDYYIFLNSPIYRFDLMYDYLHQPMALKYFNKDGGVKFASAWYERNLNIYNNILLNLSKTDKTIVILFGGAHTAVLRQYFENHPLFEIVELDKILK